MQDVLRGRRRRGYDPNDERYYVSDTNTGMLITGLSHNIDNEKESRFELTYIFYCSV